MPDNIGNQKVTLLYHTIANSLEVNIRYMNIRQKGIYKGGWYSWVDNSHLLISPLVCEISDDNYQVRVETSDSVNISVAPGTPYIILRWNYTGAITDYMELLAVATPIANDLIVGKCTFNGSNHLNGFLYTDRNNPNVQNLFLKVEETGDSDLRVRIRAGRIQTVSGNISIADQKSDLFVPPASNSKIYLVYINTTDGTINIDSSGTPSANPSPPDYTGKLVIAEITLTSTDTSIPQSKIKDVRSFITNASLAFGDRTNKDSNGNTFVRDAIYKAGCDGFIGAIGETTGSGDWTIEFAVLVDNYKPPTTARYYFSHRLSGSGRAIAPSSGNILVKKDEYFKVVYRRGSTNYNLTDYYWIPVGVGVCVKQ